MSETGTSSLDQRSPSCGDPSAYPLLARLQMVAAACADSMTLDELVSVALGQGVGSVGAAGAVLYLCRHDGLSLAGSLGVGRACEGWELLPYEEILPLTDAVRGKTAVWLPSVLDKERRYPALAATRSGFHATASLPLVAGGVQLGALGVAFNGEHGFTSAERLFLLALSDQIASTLRRIPERLPPGGLGSSPVWPQLFDPDRLAAVRRLRAVEGISRGSFDRFARLAAAVCGAPLAHVSLVDRDRVFVGSHGEGPLGADMPLEESLCLVTVAAGQLVEIGHAATDGRIRSLSSVTSGRIGAYLGVPIVSDGHTVGAVCVVDPAPGEWPAGAADRLADVAAAVSDELGMRVAVDEHERATDRASRVRALQASLIETETTAQVAEVAVEHLCRLVGVAGADLVQSAETTMPRRAPAVGRDAARRLDADAVRVSAAVGECLRSGRPVRALDLVAVMTEFRGLMPDMLALGARAAVAWPVPARRVAAIVLALQDASPVGGASEGLLAEMATVVGRHLDRVELAEHDERLRAEMAFLVEAALQLDLGLDVDQTLARAARIAVPGLAGRCVVHLLDGGSLRPVAVAHVDARLEPDLWVEQLQAAHPSADGARDGFGLARQVLDTGRSALRAANEDGHRREAGDDTSPHVGWALSMPLRTGGRLLGVLSLAQAQRGPAGRPPRVSFAESLASRVAVAIDNALLYQHRDEAARTLARRLLPPSLPVVPDVELAARYHPADTALNIGGDFYDAVPRRDGSLAIVIGDVCGRGAEAASITAIARHTLRVVLEDGATPAAALSRLNRTLRTTVTGYERLTTAAVITLRVDGLRTDVTVCSAGHPLPILIRSDRPPEEVGVASLLLGVLDEPALVETLVRLDAGDTMLIYTDGVTESRGPAGMLETDGLLSALVDAAGLPAGVLLDSISDMLARFRDRGDDDVAMLAMRLRGQPVLRTTFPPGTDMGPRAQAAVYDVLSGLPSGQTTERRGVIAAIAGQLADRVSNVGAHGCELAVYQLGRGLRFEVRDPHGPPLGRERHSSAGLTLGEGPWVTQALRVGVLDEPEAGFWCEVEMAAVDG